METKDICIIKRDGKRENFSSAKIYNAITKAFVASDLTDCENLIDEITQRVINHFNTPTIGVEEIQDLVEMELMKVQPEVAKKYIIYRQWRNTERDRKTKIKHIMDGIVAIDKNDVNLSNANMSSHTPAGQMMTFASEITKDYTYKYLLPKKYAEAHQLGDIHIHDLDYYPTKTTTCIQYDLEDLFERGFHTKNGSIRTPQSIQSYATLATIIFQTNQNEQHGGQAIPAFDFFMAKGVLKSYQKSVASIMSFFMEMKGIDITEETLKDRVKKHLMTIIPSEDDKNNLNNMRNESLTDSAYSIVPKTYYVVDASGKVTQNNVKYYIYNSTENEDRLLWYHDAVTREEVIASMLKEEYTQPMEAKDTPQIQILHHPKVADKVIEQQSIPVYDVEAAANLKTLLEPRPQYALGKIQIPNIPLCDGAVYVSGDSMYPILKAGDIVGFRFIHDFDAVIYGEMYLVSFRRGGDEYLTVKYVNRSEDPGCLRLTSYNTHHEPMDVPLEQINAMAIVKFSIRKNMMM